MAVLKQMRSVFDFGRESLTAGIAGKYVAIVSNLAYTKNELSERNEGAKTFYRFSIRQLMNEPG